MSNYDEDVHYMTRAIELAKKGVGWTNPNPMVGAVIVKNGRIIGEGYHQKYGELHAERNAIAALTESASGATIYVTLEPCCHYGKTPPCTEAIIENKIKKVVIGSRDPNPKVSGKGVEILRNAGIEVVEDFMREECDLINKVFFHYITTKTPYIVMKYAMSADGKIATKTGESKWITGEESRNVVQKMRSRYMGILVGINTVIADNPMLNVRIDAAKSPIRIICDSNLRIPLESNICKSANEYKTIVVCADVNEKKEELNKIGIEVICVPDANGEIDLKELTKKLGEKGIDSIFVEGGGTINDSFLRAGLVNELKVFMAPKIIGGKAAVSPVAGLGIEHMADCTNMEFTNVSRIGEDLLIEMNCI